ncbi:hypothetical protein [Burkholderia cenocepacia]|uniref:hypothetical protein n=1 Tax=Burkholderia cenocepacia TaxID=95486 RepID=UPI002237F6CC|nr:hypothetical protein [Burkholderia cenocepacia]MCW5141069.1 hypothetical protein [Burkholderia cenocepacia]
MSKVGRPKGLPKTGGRQKGTPNKLTADVKALARQYGPNMIDVLAKIAQSRSAPAAAKVAAARELLDRGYGKPTQHVAGPDGGPIPFNVTGELAMTPTAAYLKLMRGGGDG